MMLKSNRLYRRLALVVGLTTAIGGLVSTVPASSAVPDGARAFGSIMYAGHAQAVPDSYVVVLRDGASTESTDRVKATTADLTKQYGGNVQFTYTSALKGFAVKVSERQARRLAADPRVAYVAQDQKVSVNVFVQPAPPSWGLDRVDQRSLPLDSKYHYPSTAPTARAYIIDTGIRFTHQEFGGRAVLGVDTVGDGRVWRT